MVDWHFADSRAIIEVEALEVRSRPWWAVALVEKTRSTAFRAPLCQQNQGFRVSLASRRLRSIIVKYAIVGRLTRAEAASESGPDRRKAASLFGGRPTTPVCYAVAPLIGLLFLAGGPASADPVAPWWRIPGTTGLGLAGLINLPLDLLALWVAGRLLGLFPQGLDRRFIAWGLAIWIGGLAADTFAARPQIFREYVAMVGVTMCVIFAWNLLLAVGAARAGWRGVGLAAAIAVLTTPYWVPPPLPLPHQPAEELWGAPLGAYLVVAAVALLVISIVRPTGLLRYIQELLTSPGRVPSPGILRADTLSLFLWWGTAIWLGGVTAQGVAGWVGPFRNPPHAAAAVTAGLVFAANLIVAVAAAKQTWRRGAVIAGVIAVMAAAAVYWTHRAEAGFFLTARGLYDVMALPSLAVAAITAL
jgi:hypothetical protein